MKIKLFYCSIIILAVALCYANTLPNPFIWDQEVGILGNPLIKDWKFLPQVFTTNVEGRHLTGISFYRPLEVVSFMWDYTFWKFNPAGYHITSAVLHAANAILIFALLGLMGMGSLAAFLAAFIFALHPVNTETVTYSIRGDMLSVLFSLLAFIFYLRFCPKKTIYGYLSLGFFLLALFSKEMAVVLPLVILSYALIFRKERPVHRRVLIALLVVSICYGAFRVFGALTQHYQALSTITFAPLWQRLLTLPRIILTYLGLLIFPLNLHMEYLFVERSITSPFFLFGLLLLIGAFFVCVRFIRLTSKSAPHEAKLMLFFLLWFFIGLAPFYNILVTLHATLCEHWSYFPGIGLVAFAVVCSRHIFLNSKFAVLKSVIKVMAMVLIVYYAATTIRRNLEWRDQKYLYEHDLKYEPNSFILHNNAGVIAYREGDLAKAKVSFQKAVDVSPNQRYEVACNNLGVIYGLENNDKKAEEYFRKSIAINNYELAYENLSRLCLRQERIEEGINIALEGSEVFPYNPEIRYYLALGYYLNSQPDPARKNFEYIRKISPGYRDVDQFLEKLANG